MRLTANCISFISHGLCSSESCGLKNDLAFSSVSKPRGTSMRQSAGWIFSSLLNARVVSSFTFFIFLFHEPTLTIIKKLLFRLIGNTDFSHVVVYFIAPILTFHAGSLGARKIKYHFPELYKIITGGR